MTDEKLLRGGDAGAASWYRNAGRTKYHRARPDWIRSGRAACGARIASPAYVADKVEQIPASVGACARCKRRAS